MKEIQKNRSQYSNNKQKNSSLKTIQIQNGSTKATSSLLGNGFLSQEFIVSKDKNQRKKVQNQKISKKQNLFDLERTLDINIEILKNYFKTTTSTMTLLNQDQPIMEKLEKIIKTHNKKKEIINKIKEKKSKNLIQQQICMEHKRKLEETIEKYKDSLFDNEDAVNNKDEYVKLFQKKFVEVEIYLKRITTDMQDIRRKKYYQNYKMDNFLILNTNLNKKKQKIIEDISKYDSDKRNLKSENQKIKKEEVIEHIKDDENENEIKNEQKELKAKNELIKETYNVLIKDKIDKINILKQFIENHNKIENMIMNKNEIKINSENNNININKVSENKNPMFKKVNVKKVTNERNKINKNKNDEIQKSNLPNDMSKRMDSFMDLSIINSQLKTSVIRGPNNKSILWGDMSAIGKNEDDI
jgi:hypothetical protein